MREQQQQQLLSENVLETAVASAFAHYKKTRFGGEKNSTQQSPSEVTPTFTSLFAQVMLFVLREPPPEPL